MSNDRRDEHMMILARTCLQGLRRNDSEYGGWGLDDKRPFGNSDVETDILKLIGIGAGDEGYSAAQREYAADLYGRLGDFLRERVELALKR